jgi:ankyrin repeat protein
VNERTADGTTALMLAARYNPSPELLSVLLKAGADARLKSAEGKSAYDLALGNAALAGSRQLEELRRAGQ